jgi:predicted DNA-binding transcriptional regulator YafY
MQKTERLVAITLLLQARGKMTARRLANILGVSTRTVYRDIITLSLAHVPVSMDYGPGGGYYLPEDYHLESAIFTREEAISLILSADMSGNYNLFACDTDLHRALIKLEAVLPEEYRKDIKVAREHILYDTATWSSNPPAATYLEMIRTAVLEAHQLDILYPYQNQHTEVTHVCWRRIEPQGLVFKGQNRRHVRTGRWYLVAFCHHCQSFETFRVSDIKQLHVLSEQNLPRPQFNLRAFWREARKQLEKSYPPVTLTLRVSPSAYSLMREDISIITEDSDGYKTVQVQLESPDAAINYVLALGTEAVVLAPTQIREAVVNTVHAIVNQSQY